MSSTQKVRRFVLAVACASAAAFLLTAPASARADDDTYAAIAFSPTKAGHAGFGSNVDSREKADQAALDNSNADDAQVLVRVKNGYCFVALDANNKYGIGSDKDERTARKAAIADYLKTTGNDKFQGQILSTHSNWPKGVHGGNSEPVLVPSTLKELDAPAPSVADEIIRLTNVERKRAGVPELTANATLTAVEVKYAKLMAQKDKLAHDLDGDPGDRFTRGGYKWMRWGENAAFEQADAAAVVKAWMDDPPHKANLLNPDFTEIGVGVANNADGKPYYAQGFGTPAP